MPPGLGVNAIPCSLILWEAVVVGEGFLHRAGMGIAVAARRVMKIQAGSVEATAVLNDTRTGDAIWEALPLAGRANRWGDEIYFSIGRAR